jgi:hypothetical protein
MMNSRPGGEIADGIVQWIVFLVGEMCGKPWRKFTQICRFPTGAPLIKPIP